MSAIRLRAVLIQGAFDETDWRELCDTIRRIEQRHPEELYIWTGVEPTDRPLEDMVAFIERTFPRVDGKPPVVTKRELP